VRLVAGAHSIVNLVGSVSVGLNRETVIALTLDTFLRQ